MYNNNVEYGVLVMLVLVMLALVMLALGTLTYFLSIVWFDVLKHCTISKRIVCLQKYPHN